mgnify:CR=1 FL=1
MNSWREMKWTQWEQCHECNEIDEMARTDQALVSSAGSIYSLASLSFTNCDSKWPASFEMKTAGISMPNPFPDTVIKFYTKIFQSNMVT